MAPLPDRISQRVRTALENADPSVLAATDQVSKLWSDWFDVDGLDLADPQVNRAVKRSLTMVYALLMMAGDAGELPPAAWGAIDAVLGAATAAVAVVAQQRPPTSNTI